ncbi:trimeric intracellular cation channel family protein [Ferrovibrio xuzhouensis]|uniref:Trimeric intracellular cation channel family protein n=1 Tax=Ferrovibrio xuzhouensis TaxID=1576914 RepID=A0ABV7VJ33_9PROT
MLLTILDYTGTFVFALSGAAAGVRQRLDLFGVLVLSFAAASAGGILRDLLIGALPPAAIRDWAYPALAGVAGLLVFFCFPLVHRLRHPVQVFDAAGLALFAVLGTQKALLFDINPLAAAMLGIMSGIGGGMLRDVLLAQVPQVLKAEVYAVAALAGAAVVVAADALGLPPVAGVAAGGLLCFVIRLLAIRYGWRIMTARWPGTGDGND